MARYYYSLKNYKEAKKYYKQCETIFLKQNNKKLAIFHSYWYLISYKYELKQCTMNNEDYNNFIKDMEFFLEKYKEFSNTYQYLEIMLEYYKVLSNKCRIFENNLEKSVEFLKKCYEIAKELYNNFGDRYLNTKKIFEYKYKAIMLELNAKKEIQNKNFRKAIELFLEASKLYGEINDEKNKKWCLANYYSHMVKDFSFSNNFDKAREYYKKAEELFLELNLRKPAMFCLFLYLDTYRYELKQYKKNIKKYEKIINKYIEDVKYFLEKYKDYSNTYYYLEVKLGYYKYLAIKHRKFEGNLDKAIEFTKECYKLAEESYKKFGSKYLKDAEVYNKHMYYNLMAQKYENEREFTKAAEYYKKSGDVIKAVNEKIAYDEYANCYKWLAIVNKYDKEKFEEYINKAIEFAKKINDEKQIYYYFGLKYDHLVKFADSLEKKIEYLKKAKEYYYKSGNIPNAKYEEYLQYYYQSKYELKNGNYENALKMLQHAKKALNKINELKISNISISKINQSIVSDEWLYNFYLYVSMGDFDKSLEMLNKYLEISSEWKNTRKYKFYEYLKECIIILSKISTKKYFSNSDLSTLENVIINIKKDKISLNLYKIAILTYAYVSLWINNIRDKELFEKIKLKIIKRITSEDVTKDLENKIKIQLAIEKHDWMLKLPPTLIEKFDSCLYFLEEVLDEFKHTAYREFYTLLENYLKIVVEFNAKHLYGDDWKDILEEKIPSTKKPFDKFTFGDLFQSLRLLKNEGSIYCKDIDDEILELLDQHVNIRNRLTHDFMSAVPEDVDIIEDTLKIMYAILRAFPICIKIIDDRKKPWYRVEIIWNQLPKKVSLYSEQDLGKGCTYFVEPYSYILDKNKMHPKVILPIEVSKDIICPSSF